MVSELRGRLSCRIVPRREETCGLSTLLLSLEAGASHRLPLPLSYAVPQCSWHSHADILTEEIPGQTKDWNPEGGGEVIGKDDIR